MHTRKLAFMLSYQEEGIQRSFIFKLLPASRIHRIFKALKEEQAITDYTLRRKVSSFRTGYVNESTLVEIEWNETRKLNLPFLLRMIDEMIMASGYEVHHEDWDIMLNLEIEYINKILIQ